ncbi:hypothetical protein OHA21_37550 [Actinoplanes sp. NBC_00393]|uniref:hypothetical protein n=1 Tax=Actinoplanes sp. NBC_00393 TaxID=2975953 RepID=UPI002E25172C
MRSMRTRLFAALAALPLAAGLLAASPAQAEPAPMSLTSISVSKPSFVLSGKAGCTTVATFTAVFSEPLPPMSEGWEASEVILNLLPPGATRWPSRPSLATFQQVGTSATYRGNLPLCGRNAPGAYRAKIHGFLMRGPTTSDADLLFTNALETSFSIRRPAKLTLNAAPEPVRKGKKLTAKGTLKVDGKALTGVQVKIYFKAAGATTWTHRGTAVTSKTGAYSKKFTATRTGTWKAVYAGAGTRTSASAADAVKVK